MNMLGGSDNRTAGTGAGLGELLSSFEQAGLGHIAQSWSATALTNRSRRSSCRRSSAMIGAALARQAGMAPHDFLSQLSQHLPRVVDGVTPNGQLPDEGTLSV